MGTVRRFAAGLILTALAATVCLAQFQVTTTPTNNGNRITADLPPSQQHKNVGGSDGAGLCVYTSAWHASLWQSVDSLNGFRGWMEKRPGGSYPQKFDSTIAAYCKSTGVPVPPYVQHTGGDEAFLYLALKTGRMPCITYCGVDGAGRYGSEVIAHMVNLVYLSDTQAAILDNNFPGTWLWMSATDFLNRWRGTQSNGQPFMSGRQPIGGGWAIVLLAGQPSPYPAQPQAVASRGNCSYCGDHCKCELSNCPLRCPVSGPMIGQCPGGQCPNGRCPLPLSLPVLEVTGPTSVENLPAGRGVASTQSTHPGCLWKYVPGIGDAWIRPEPDFDWGPTATGWGWVPKEAQKIKESNPMFPPNGVDGAQLFSQERRYSINGEPVTREEAHAALELVDDSALWNLTTVGDAGFLSAFKADVLKLPTDLASKLNVKTYAPGAWQVSQFNLVSGVTLRKPAVGRVGADVGSVLAGNYTAAKLSELFTLAGGPNPAPTPAPTPVAPVPAPTPSPAPVAPTDPAPVDTGDNSILVIIAIAVAGAFLIYSSGKKGAK